MRIFFIHQFYRTPEEGGGIRSWYVTRALQKAGHEVTIVAGQMSARDEPSAVSASEKRDEPSAVSENEERLPTLKLRQLKRREAKVYEAERPEDGVEVIRLPVGWDNSMSFWERIKAFLKFLYLARKEAKKHEYDMVYAVSVPLSSGLLAMWTKKPFLFEVGDLWPDVPIQMRILKNPLLKMLSKRLEKKIYKKADLIISLSLDIQRHIYQKWPYTANIVVENFADLAMFKKQKDESSQNSDIICTYVGTAGMANDLMQMVELAKVAEKQFPKIRFYLMIAGKEEEKIKNSAPSNVHFIDYGNKEKVAGLLARSDFNFVTYAQYPILGTGSPNKFFDGLAAGCISVINVKGWIEELIIKEKAGIYWDVSDPMALLNSIQNITEDSDLKHTYQFNALNLAERFDKDILVHRIVQQIEVRFE
ncbi:glycosyltransferase family 4 protein [Hyphobacterium sp. CCMP332]|nr:glycosyltransferase family 4 protein [Hyphobacterium sp. CCMP332]